jgi:hypothetical protein
MRLPAWIRPGRTIATPGAVTITLELDTTALEAELAKMGAHFRGMGDAAQRAADAMNAAIREPVRRRRAALARIQAGNIVRWQVRGGLDPAYADPRDRDAMVRELCRGGGYQAHDLAAAFLRGWVESRDPATCQCVPTPEKFWTTHYGAVEPGSAWEEGPDGCPVHVHRGETVRFVNGWSPWVHFRQRWIMGMNAAL